MRERITDVRHGAITLLVVDFKVFILSHDILGLLFHLLHSDYRLLLLLNCFNILVLRLLLVVDSYHSLLLSTFRPLRSVFSDLFLPLLLLLSFLLELLLLDKFVLDLLRLLLTLVPY
jgi:hypothetical protein